MIQRSHFIESADDWLCSPIASTNDGLLCAFVSLRLLTSNIPELLSPQSGTQREHLHHVRPLINAIKGQIDRWQHRWSRIAVQGMPFRQRFRAFVLTTDKSAAIPFSRSFMARTHYCFSSRHLYSHPFPTKNPSSTWKQFGSAIARR